MYVPISLNEDEKKRWIRSIEGNITQDEELENNDLIDWVAPVYRVNDIPGKNGLISSLPSVILLKLNDNNFENELNQLGLTENKEKSKFLISYKYYHVNNPKEKSSFEIASELEHFDWVKDIKFEDIPMIEPTLLIPNDPIYNQQWNLQRINLGGNTNSGWDISIGSDAIAIGVIDHPCNLLNEDLDGNVKTILLSQMEESNFHDQNKSHGTRCIGIIGAKINNNLGIAGIAPKCKIISFGTTSFSDSDIAAGINYAAKNGIRIISMSFGFYLPEDGRGPVITDSTHTDAAIENAFNKGCILFAATGNENLPLNRWPARHKLIIACGASDQADNRKNLDSPDGQTDWGSNFGKNLSVVAPGVNIPTTSHSGGSELVFRGTSASTPQVAGLAALILSKNPLLTNLQVRQLIESNTDKVGVLPYEMVDGFPNGNRNNEMGYGRINTWKTLSSL